MKPFTVVNVPQRSPEWLSVRAGRLTSSCVNAVFMEGRAKGTESATKRDLRIRLALERLTGRSLDVDGYRSREMEHGTEKEPEARLAYEAARGVIVQEAGFCAHDELMIGCSLDGYVGDYDVVTEFKCPKSATHWASYKEQRIPSEYLPQLTHQLLVTGAQAAEFISFDDRFPEDLQLVILRLPRERADLAKHEAAVKAFLDGVDACLLEMRTAAVA